MNDRKRGRRVVAAYDIPEDGVPVEEFAGPMAQMKGWYLVRDELSMVEALLRRADLTIMRDHPEGRVTVTLLAGPNVEAVGETLDLALAGLLHKVEEAERG